MSKKKNPTNHTQAKATAKQTPMQKKTFDPSILSIEAILAKIQAAATGQSESTNKAGSAPLLTIISFLDYPGEMTRDK